MADEQNINLEQYLKLARLADQRLDDLEASTPRARDLTLLSSGWTNDSGDAVYSYQYILTIDGVTAASRADAELDDSSIAVASNCGMCAKTKTADNAVIFKSVLAPEADLTGVIYITKTVAASGTT